jgi:hypothetical protein
MLDCKESSIKSQFSFIYMRIQWKIKENNDELSLLSEINNSCRQGRSQEFFQGVASIGLNILAG